MMLDHKNAVITGAGGGIGREIAMTFAREGAAIALIDVSDQDLNETCSLIKNLSRMVFAIAADISDESSVRNAFQEILARFSRIDILVNCAGIQKPIGRFDETDLAEWRRNVEVNLFGTVHCTHAVLDSMIKNRYGKIINFSGGGSTSPRPCFSAYAAAKTAMVRFTETAAEEFREYRIDINAVAPGAVNTRMLDEVLSVKEHAGKEYKEALERKKSGGNDPRLAAELVCFLASDRSDGITGKLISAPWDPWQDEEFQERLRKERDLGTLRRIDDKTFFGKR